MEFEQSDRVVELNARLESFIRERVYPGSAGSPDEVHMSQLGKLTLRELAS